jgi:hypothetical protein
MRRRLIENLRAYLLGQREDRGGNDRTTIAQCARALHTTPAAIVRAVNTYGGIDRENYGGPRGDHTDFLYLTGE